jgi:hypothetical protein
MIPFSKRRDLIREAQHALRLRADGIDGRRTWHALGTRFLIPGHPAMRGISPNAGPVAFEGRQGLVSAVQSALRVSVDGRDGPETWGAIMERLAPIPTSMAPYRPISAGYPEGIRGRSPNRNAGVNERIGIVFHHCAGSFEGTISWCLKQGTNAAYHCLIGHDGRRAIMGLDTDRLHHAGQSTWNGTSGCNAFMLGIAFTGNTVTGARRASPSLNIHELSSAVEWVREKQRQYGILDRNITHHRVVSPGRKDDLSLDAWNQVKTVLGLR